MQELTTIAISKDDAPKGLGGLPYENLPRIGEWVEIEEQDGKAIMYEVIMLAHSTTGGSADVYVKRLADLVSAIQGLSRLI